MNRNLIRSIAIIFIAIILLNSFILAGFGMTRFWQGFHNLDSAYNMDKISQVFNVELTDTGNDGIERTSREYHRIGLYQITTGLTYSMIGSLIFGVFLILSVILFFADGKLDEEVRE